MKVTIELPENTEAITITAIELSRYGEPVSIGIRAFCVIDGDELKFDENKAKGNE